MELIGPPLNLRPRYNSAFAMLPPGGRLAAVTTANCVPGMRRPRAGTDSPRPRPHTGSAIGIIAAIRFENEEPLEVTAKSSSGVFRSHEPDEALGGWRQKPAAPAKHPITLGRETILERDDR